MATRAGVFRMPTHGAVVGVIRGDDAELEGVDVHFSFERKPVLEDVANPAALRIIGQTVRRARGVAIRGEA